MARAPRPQPSTASILLIAIFLMAGLLPANFALAGEYRAGSPIQGGRLVLPERGPAFLMAINYEGPADRAWQMWEDGKFDPALIEADLRRAREAGFTAVRAFVQAPLARDVQSGNWDKLDRFLAMARQQGLSVIVSLYDYGERDLGKVADVAGRIASRYSGDPTILAYDLKNEPQFSDLASAVYPGGARAPIQGGDAAETLRLYQQMVDRAGAWVVARGYLVTALDYLDSPDGRQWDPLLARMNESLAMWIQPQLEAIRRADGLRPVTVSYSNLFLAKLPANGALDYVTVHRYPGASATALSGVSRTLNNLRATFPGKPVLLGEFGYSNAAMSPEESANYEIGLYLQLVSEGLAGGGKWMLNDFPTGFNPTQNAYGAFTADGTAKPVVAAVRALSDYLSRSTSPGGHLYVLDRPPPGYRWAYEADDALIVSASNYRGTRLSFQPERLSQLFLTWTDPGTMRIYSTTHASLELDPSAVLRDPGMGSNFSLIGVDGASRNPAPFTQEGSRLKVSLEGGRWYELALPRAEGSGHISRPLDYDFPGGRFFTQTNGRPLGASAAGFAVTDSEGVRFWSEFQRLGGWPVIGYPITQRFMLDGFVTQAFQKGVLQWRPEVGQAYFLNTFDLMHDRGLDDWLRTYRQTPEPFDTSPDTGLSWEEVVQRHLSFLDGDEAIKARFLSNPDWLEHYGLPVSYADIGNSFVVRAQRATFQRWKEDVPWAAAGEVTVANGGDLAKEAYLWPVQAVVPQAPPSR
jgi:hypothetical protein